MGAKARVYALALYDGPIQIQRRAHVAAMWIVTFLACLYPAIVVGQAGQVSAPTKTQSVASDPYAPLRLYDGRWDVVMAGADKSANKPAEPVHVENHCARAGEYFTCNQLVNGKNMALIVFLPLHALDNGGYAYKNQALSADDGGSGHWGNLEITGDHWVYSSDETENGKKIYHRILNEFSGPDKIHFEVQQSDDGNKWATTMSGDEARAK